MPSPHPLPTWKKLGFALATTVAALVAATAALGALERLGWIDSHRKSDTIAYVRDGALARRTTREGVFFELMDSHHPELVQERFPVTPAPGTVRIVVTGGSFIRGEHHVQPGEPIKRYGSIPAWLEAVLEQRLPSVPIEVINAGASAQSSERIRALTPHLLETGPDVLVLATGNNEGWVPPHGLHGVLHDWVLYRALHKQLDPEPAQAPVFQPQDPDSSRIRGGFRANLLAIDHACAEAGVELVLATLPLGLALYPTEPFEHPPDAAIERGEQACAAGDLDRAMAEFALSERQAQALARASLCQLEAGQVELARDLMRSAIELEPKGRTRPSLNAIVREVASSRQRTLVDLEHRFAELEPDGLPGGIYFWDAAHMTSDGYRWVAGEVSEVLVTSGALPVEETPAPIPSLDSMLERRGWRQLHQQVSSTGL